MTIAEQIEAHKKSLTLKKFGEIVGVSYDTVYSWVRECSLPAIKIRGSYWIDPEEAARWWRAQSTIVAKPRSARAKHVA